MLAVHTLINRQSPFHCLGIVRPNKAGVKDVREALRVEDTAPPARREVGLAFDCERKDSADAVGANLGALDCTGGGILREAVYADCTCPVAEGCSEHICFEMGQLLRRRVRGEGVGHL